MEKNQENQENHEIKITRTNKGKEQVILNSKYKFNLSNKRKDNTKKFKCTEYKTMNKCPSFIILNDKNEVLEYNGSHNHLEKRSDATKSLVKGEIKDRIDKSSDPYNENLKRAFDEICKKIGGIPPDYTTIKSQLSNYKRKKLPDDIKTFDEIPDESIYFKTENDENFMIFKNDDLLIFQSPFQAKLFSKYKDVFADGTFDSAPKPCYQIFITRTYVKKINGYYTTSFSLLRNKTQTAYETLLEEIKKNSNKYNNGIEASPKIFHCDFERAISNAVINIFPNANIKYCVFHYKNTLEKQLIKLCGNNILNNADICTHFNDIMNLPFINPEYIYDIYNKIKNECQEKRYDQFLEFLDYFKKNYLISYETNYWNYYDNIEHITNNASESYNKYLNNLFQNKKPNFFQLLLQLQKEEYKSFNDYDNRMKGNWGKIKQRKLIRTDEIKALVNYYKNMEILLGKKGSDRNDFVNLWLDCLRDLKIKIIN